MNSRKPFIVEFTGTPEAGKTTVIDILYEALSQAGYKVKKYPESAEKTPKIFPKNSLEAKLWMNFDTAKHVLEAPFLTDYDIVIFDRGALDRTFWLHVDSVFTPEIAHKTASSTKILNEYLPDLLISLYVSESESIRRRGGEGRIVTRDFVASYNRLLKTFINSLRIDKVVVSTDNKPIEEVVETVKNAILEHLKSHS